MGTSDVRMEVYLVTAERGDGLPRTNYPLDLLNRISRESSMGSQRVIVPHEAVYETMLHKVWQPQRP